MDTPKPYLKDDIKVHSRVIVETAAPNMELFRTVHSALYTLENKILLKCSNLKKP